MRAIVWAVILIPKALCMMLWIITNPALNSEMLPGLLYRVCKDALKISFRELHRNAYNAL